MNLGGPALTDSSGVYWSSAFGLVQAGGQLETSDPIEGTTDDELYQSGVEGATLDIDLKLDPGTYELKLHLAEIEHLGAGARVFEVYAEESLISAAVDPAGAAGHDVAHVLSFPVTVADGQLDLLLLGLVDLALLNALEVRAAPFLVPDTAEVQFGSVATGSSAQMLVSVANLGAIGGEVTEISFVHGASGNSADFSVSLGGQFYAGSTTELAYTISKPFAAMSELLLTVQFAPTDETYDLFEVVLKGDFPDLSLSVVGLGGHEGHPFLHIVTEVDSLVVDYDGDGFEDVVLNGVQSHTHEPGASLIGHSWTEGAVQVASAPLAAVAGRADIRCTIDGANREGGEQAWP